MKPVRIPRSGRAILALPLLSCILRAVPSEAQEAGIDSVQSARASAPFLVGTRAEDRLRLDQVVGGALQDGYLLRSPSARLLRDTAGSARFRVLRPSLLATWNSRLPFSIDDGSLWAGRGTSTRLVAGAAVQARGFTLVLAPELLYSQNLDFPILGAADSSGSLFASRWHTGRQSADLPQRFGDARILELLPGQSTLAFSDARLSLGLSTENEWWGPGVVNAIVMSNQAAGFPHAFVRTRRPVRSPLGAVEAEWLAGTLTESLYFDARTENDLRALSGFVATVRPTAERGLTLGVARTVYAADVSRAGALGHALDAFTWWGRSEVTTLDTLPADEPGVRARPTQHDQILSVFGRWIFPADGFEVWTEWARAALPTSAADFLSDPGHTQGYTLGVQWARPVGRQGAVRFLTEVTYLEESASVSRRPGKSFYVSPSVVQGYTNRGQAIGAAIGPGGSSQWAAADFLGDRVQAGIFGSRIRWDDDVYYALPGRKYLAHDVSLLGGLRVGARLAGYLVTAELARAERFNYLFQNPEYEPYGNMAVDRWNTTVRLEVVPLRW